MKKKNKSIDLFFLFYEKNTIKHTSETILYPVFLGGRKKMYATWRFFLFSVFCKNYFLMYTDIVLHSAYWFHVFSHDFALTVPSHSFVRGVLHCARWSWSDIPGTLLFLSRGQFTYSNGLEKKFIHCSRIKTKIQTRHKHNKPLLSL